MAAKGKQQTISKFFAPKHKPNEKIRTDADPPPKKKCKIVEVELTSPPKRSSSFSSDDDFTPPKKPKCNGTSSSSSKSFKDFPKTETKTNNLGDSPTKKKLELFRFKGDVNRDDGANTSPTTNSSPTSSKGKGFVIPKGVKLTPLETQVVAIKDKYPDTLLFVECGYKYRFFGEDAEMAAKELNIVAHLDHNFQTASIPTHRLHIHVRRLVAKGYKVGVVKQTETAALKAIGTNKTAPFSREMSALYTKATLIGEDVSPIGAEDASDVTEATTSSLMVLTEIENTERKDNKTGIVLVSIQPNTGDVVYDMFDDTPARTLLWGRLEQIQPVEVIVGEEVSNVTRKAIRALMTRHDDCIRIESLSESQFDYSPSLHSLCHLYEGREDTIRHISDLPHPVIGCLGATLHYLMEFKLERILKNAGSITKLSSDKEFMTLPGPTLRNLEVIVNNVNREERGSLFWVLNQTSTKFGARVLRQWLLHPLLNVERITERQDMVGEFIESDATPISTLKTLLQNLPDFEKSITTIFYKKCSPLEFCVTVSGLSKLQRKLSAVCGSNLQDAVRSEPLANLMSTVQTKLANVHQFSENIDESSAKENKKTGLFKDWSEFASVVERRREMKCVEMQLAELRPAIGRTLSVSSFDYTTVSGLEYLIEVKNNKLKSVPPAWTKINLTKTCCRFRSKEVEKLFTKLQQLREQHKADCQEAWMEVLERFSEHYQDYREAVKCLGSLDALISLAKVAQCNGYCKPRIDDSAGASLIRIKGGKHPIVHQLRGDDQFVVNDTNMASDGERVMLVTGPNMGGKSCYMRQVALIALMAQVGSYVPADEVTVSILDGIYTRMGATDEIFSGRSSLMVEVSETADVMRDATHRSLVILDELGRGTSTHDGVAIATAALDYFLHKIKCLTIFVTHYLTLCEFGERCPESVGNHHMSFIVNEEGGEDDVDVITFLYQLTSGNAGQSYGLNVARLANLPPPVLKKASYMSKALQKRTNRIKVAKEIFKKIFSEEDLPKGEKFIGILDTLKSSEIRVESN